MSSLLDQTRLLELAERLVEAAKRAGADAADAVAVRGVSQSIQVRDGAVEESERSEGDDVGLRVLVGKRQAVVSTNDTKGNGAATLAERAVSMARVAPEDPYAGLADAALLAKQFPDLDLVDPELPDTATFERQARAAEEAALSVKGVTKSGGANAGAGIGGMVLVTSHGFRGSYVRSSHGISTTAIAGEGTGMERDYDFTSTLHSSDLGLARRRSAAARASARSAASIRARSRRGKSPVIFDPRIASTLVGHLAGAINGASIARKTSFLKDRMGERLFRAGIRIVDDPLRRRGLRSRPFDGEGIAGEAARGDRRRRADVVVPRLGHRARTLARHHGTRGTRRVVIALAFADQPAHRTPATSRPKELIGRHQGRLLRHRPDRQWRQPRHRRLQPRRVGPLDRERRTHLSGERGHDRRKPHRHVRLARARERSRVPATAPTRRPCAWRA